MKTVKVTETGPCSELSEPMQPSQNNVTTTNKGNMGFYKGSQMEAVWWLRAAFPAFRKQNQEDHQGS